MTRRNYRNRAYAAAGKGCVVGLGLLIAGLFGYVIACWLASPFWR